ncbi:peptidoglycan-binding domain-containing protein [Streptomyces sp. NPDC005899]|uniref:peptidoglycan-binding domain-containing protein n=1 Tax=Streptomyces sp. NPDC005899 TaxID=3155716 RepID=UPI003411C21D
MTGHICPECGGELRARPEPGAGPGPGCVCGAGPVRPPGDGHLAARSAEMAAAEDFDPLRIRPYVTLTSDDSEDHGAPAADTTMPLFLGDPPPGGGAGAVSSQGPPAGATTADGAHRRSVADYAGTGPDPVRPRRRRPLAAVAVGAAVALVVGTAAFASGLFDDGDRGDEALPELTTSIPDLSGEPSASASASPSAPPSSTPPPSASPASASASASSSPSPPRSPSASASATASRTPSPSVSPTRTASAQASPTAPALAAGTTLRPGDSGPEVAELQRRMQEIWVYRGPADADYSSRVEAAVRDFQRWVSVRSDPPGVYGPETRRALEAQTTGTGRRS